MPCLTPSQRPPIQYSLLDTIFKSLLDFFLTPVFESTLQQIISRDSDLATVQPKFKVAESLGQVSDAESTSLLGVVTIGKE